MTTAGPVSAYVLAQTLATTQAKSAQTSTASNSNSVDTTDTFGSATNVTLSPVAQAILAGQNPPTSTSTASTTSTPATASTSAPAPATSAPPKSPSVPITTTSTTTDTATLIQEALQQVIPKVGITDASEVVDSQGNIDQVKLQELILQQDQAQSISLQA